MKKIFSIVFLFPIIAYSQVKFDMANIINNIDNNQIESMMFNKFDGTFKREKKIQIAPYELDVNEYAVYIKEIYGGESHNISIYRDGKNFVQIEFATALVPPSLSKFKLVDGIEYISQVEFRNNSKSPWINYLFKYKGYAINVIAIKNEEKFEGGQQANGVYVDSFTQNPDDIIFISITNPSYFNKIMSKRFGFTF